MQKKLSNTEATSFYRDLYSWATLALSHPGDNRFMADILEILEGLNNCSFKDMDLSEEFEQLSLAVGTTGTSLLNLQQEHSRLFIGPFSLLAPPYESCYLDKGTVMGDNSKQVELFYTQAGIEISPDFKDAPDHIILEAEFLARLCDMEESAWKANDPAKANKYRKMQANFLNQHLIKWIDRLLHAVEKGARNSFYPLVLRVLKKGATRHYHNLKHYFQDPA